VLTFNFPENFTILTQVKRNTPDSDGNDVYDPATVTVTGAFAPEGSTELIQGQDTVISNPTIYLSPDSPIPAATDKVRRELTGETFDIDGQPAVFVNPFTGDQPGAVLRLERVTG
jgi:hypothetical protein